MKLDFSNKVLQWFTLALLALTWGSSFILMKKGLNYFTSTEVAAYRMTIAMIVLLPFSLRNLAKIKAKFWPLLAVGLFGSAIPAFLFAIGQTVVPSALTGILNSMTSLFTLVIGVLVFRLKTYTTQVIGVFVALIGALGLIGFQNLLDFGTYGQYSLLIVAAAGCYGVGVNVIKAHLHEMRPTHITSLSFLIVAPVLAIYLFGFTEFTHKLATKPESWWGLLYISILGIVGTAIAVVVFNKLIKNTTAVFASSVTYLIPIVALGWGLVDGEQIDPRDILYMVLILVGIFLINMKRDQLKKMFGQTSK